MTIRLALLMIRIAAQVPQSSVCASRQLYTGALPCDSQRLIAEAFPALQSACCCPGPRRPQQRRRSTRCLHGNNVSTQLERTSVWKLECIGTRSTASGGDGLDIGDGGWRQRRGRSGARGCVLCNAVQNSNSVSVSVSATDTSTYPR